MVTSAAPGCGTDSSSLVAWRYAASSPPVSAGRLFHSDGPATAKLHWPIVLRALELASCSRPVEADLRCWRHLLWCKNQEKIALLVSDAVLVLQVRKWELYFRFGFGSNFDPTKLLLHVMPTLISYDWTEAMPAIIAKWW